MGSAEDELRDGQVRVLMASAHTLTLQMAELVVAQETAVRNGAVRDDRVGRIETDLKGMKTELQANTEITKEVRDMLAAFRVIGVVGKWLGAIAGAAVSLYVAFYAATHGGQLPPKP